MPRLFSILANSYVKILKYFVVSKPFLIEIVKVNSDYPQASAVFSPGFTASTTDWRPLIAMILGSISVFQQKEGIA